MRKYLLSFLMVVSLLASFGLVEHVSAQENPRVDRSAETATKAGKDLTKDLSSVAGGLFNLTSWVLTPLAKFLMTLLGLVVALAGLILNYSIKFTVVDMSANYANLPAIDIGWSLVRDLANMSFIFILLYASIMIILGFGKDLRGLVVKMIIAAILINFSLFFTKVIIDVANLLALTFYRAIAGGELAEISKTGLANSIMDPLKLQSIYLPKEISETGVLTIALMSSVVYLVTAFSFFAVAIMFVVRYVVLIMVLILSPLMFAAMILPKFKGYTDKWWSALTSQAFFAPVYFILMWITVQLIQGISGALTNSSTSFAEALTGASGAIPIIINFAVIIVFILATLIIAKDMAGKAGGLASDWTKMAANFAFGSVVGGAGRRLIGRPANYLSERSGLVTAANKERTGFKDTAVGAAARLALYTAKKARSGTFDVRNATFPTSVIGDTVRGTIGRTKIGRAIGADDFRTKSIPLGPLAAAQTGMGAGETRGAREFKEEKEKRLQGERLERDTEKRKAENGEKIKAGLEAAKTPPGSRTPAQETAIKEMVDVIKKMTDKELETQKATTLAVQEVAEALTQKQVEALEKSPNFAATEVQNVKNSRGLRLKQAFSAGGGMHIPATPTSPARTGHQEAMRLIRKMDYSTLARLPTYDSASPQNPSFNNPDILDAYTPGILGSLARQNEFTQDKKDSLRDSIIARYNNLNANGTPIPPNLDKAYNWLTSGRGSEIYS